MNHYQNQTFILFFVVIDDFVVVVFLQYQWQLILNYVLLFIFYIFSPFFLLSYSGTNFSNFYIGDYYSYI